MEVTFMTIHNLTPDANILFASESIVDILGYQPHEVLGRSCFEYFHPDEIPFAKAAHGKGVQLDKAAVLHYAQIMHKDGQWVGCECVFTIVHDVLVACTSIYKGDDKNERRAQDAPAVRRLFASSPRDPRYHMLQHLSTKFQATPAPSIHEPRAALILNRFTRTLTVMFATNAVAEILGVSAEQLTGKSFYECIQENCLPDAIRCLESAKANDSIAYLRFWYRDPRRPAEREQSEREASNSSDDDDGGVPLDESMDIDSYESNGNGDNADYHQHPRLGHETSNSSGASSDLEQGSSSAIFDNQLQVARSSSSSIDVSNGRRSAASRRTASPSQDIEIEAVVSCTSDGLVVVLRRARQILASTETSAAFSRHENGLFAAPWGIDPIRPHVSEIQLAFQPEQLQQVQAVAAHSRATGGPSLDSFMESIREVAVFAWSLTGINGNIAKFARGKPTGQAAPSTGFPIWDPRAASNITEAPENQAFRKWSELNQRVHTNEPVSQQIAPYEHHRQEQLLRQQYGYGPGLMGSDVPGSAAREYLGVYMGDDGRGPGYFPRDASQQHNRYQFGQLHQPQLQQPHDARGETILFHKPNGSTGRDSTTKTDGNGHRNGHRSEDAVHSTRYLWY